MTIANNGSQMGWRTVKAGKTKVSMDEGSYGSNYNEGSIMKLIDMNSKETANISIELPNRTVP